MAKKRKRKINLLKHPLILVIAVLAVLLLYSFNLLHFEPVSDTNNAPQKIRTNSDVELFFVDPLKYTSSQNVCVNEPCLALVELINNAQHTIDFAVYGFEKEEKIQQALLNAKERGVKIRGVVDKTADNKSYYKDTDTLAKKLQNVKNDYTDSSKRPKKYREGIMHNKYFIVDGTYVWTGSMNISPNCITYNANVSVLIKSPELAKAFENDFEQMYAGKFHTQKKGPSKTKIVVTDDMTEIKPFFLPEDKNTAAEIINLINGAKEYIYVPIFYLTYQDYANALIRAKKRGVDVKVIVDATSVKNPSTVHKKLQKEGIEVKVENWGGKMHMKSLIVDNEYIVVGSMNFTKSGYGLNDENTLIIKNKQLASDFHDYFIYMWNTIPE